MAKRTEIQMPTTQAMFEAMDTAEAVRVGDAIYVSGQVGWDHNMKPGVGLEAQARLAFGNLKAVLEKSGAKPKHITHLMMFFVDPDPKGTTPLSELAGPVFTVKKEIMPGCVTAGTGVKVSALFFPELLLEVQAIAVVD